MGLNPWVAMTLWWSTWHLGTSKTLMDWAELAEGWDL